MVKRVMYVDKQTNEKVFVLGTAKSAKNKDVKVVIYSNLTEEENLILNLVEFEAKYNIYTKS
jgi:hypothetical protein